MGVFSRFRRRKSETLTEESATTAVAAEVQEPTAAAVPAESGDTDHVDQAEEAADGTERPAAAAPDAGDATEAEDAAAGPEASGDAAAEAADAGTPRAEQTGESAGIPRQQSVEAAADSESARHQAR
ncbi:hypothetical protein AB0F24_29835 [Streptomyces platensis]|uniref:hypothetical protein n=1 Tax=Streptomyces platensis TaxID=58346 RepID=UPI0033D35634